MKEPKDFDWNDEDSISANFYRFARECTELFVHSKNPFATKYPEIKSIVVKRGQAHNPLVMVHIDDRQVPAGMDEIGQAVLDFFDICYAEIKAILPSDGYPNFAFIRA